MDEPILFLKNNGGIKVDSSLFILDNPIIKIGRDSTADLRIPDPFISRLQAEIYYEHEKWYIRDLQSKNGSFVNDKKIGAEPVQLKHGDTISFSRKIDYLFQSENLDSDGTRSMVVSSSPYGIEMVEKSEDVLVDGIKINPRLGPQEWLFLSLLMKEPDRIHTYKELAQEMFMIAEDIFAITPYIKSLQTIKNDICKKFRKQGIIREVIKSRNGVGYQLVEKDSGK